MSENALQEEIKRHNELYYRENISEITDAEYDELAKKAGIQTVGTAPDRRFLEVGTNALVEQSLQPRRH